MRSFVLKLLVSFYKLVISPIIHTLAGPGAGCRYQPTCSEYMVGSIETHGWFSGFFIGMKRISRCHPWGGVGFDPVPAKKD